MKNEENSKVLNNLLQKINKISGDNMIYIKRYTKS